MEQNPTEELVPLAAAAAELGIQAKELRLEVDAGRLPHVRIGKRALLLNLELVRQVLRERAASPIPQQGAPQ